MFCCIKSFLTQLHIYSMVIRILVKGYLSISLITPLNLKEILNELQNTVWKTNPDYDLVIKRLHPYYDMKLVTFGIDDNKNLMVQFPVFTQPYTQQPLILYKHKQCQYQLWTRIHMCNLTHICK